VKAASISSIRAMHFSEDSFSCEINGLIRLFTGEVRNQFAQCRIVEPSTGKGHDVNVKAKLSRNA
jgi:hypothetical protein